MPERRHPHACPECDGHRDRREGCDACGGRCLRIACRCPRDTTFYVPKENCPDCRGLGYIYAWIPEPDWDAADA